MSAPFAWADVERITQGQLGRNLIVVVNLTTHGRYEARLSGDGTVLCVSTTPFFTAARKLIAAGYVPETILVMRHAGSVTYCLKSSLATAASLTVEDTKYGPRLRPWRALSTLEGARRIERVGDASSSAADLLMREGPVLVRFDGGIEERRSEKLNTAPDDDN